MDSEEASKASAAAAASTPVSPTDAAPAKATSDSSTEHGVLEATAEAEAGTPDPRGNALDRESQDLQQGQGQGQEQDTEMKSPASSAPPTPIAKDEASEMRAKRDEGEVKNEKNDPKELINEGKAVQKVDGEGEDDVTPNDAVDAGAPTSAPIASSAPAPSPPTPTSTSTPSSPSTSTHSPTTAAKPVPSIVTSTDPAQPQPAPAPPTASDATPDLCAPPPSSPSSSPSSFSPKPSTSSTSSSSSPTSTTSTSTSPHTLAPSDHPPRRSSLVPMVSSLLTPAPVRAGTPPAPANPRASATAPSKKSTRVAADLEEFDPFATPAPAAPAPIVPPKDTKDKRGGTGTSGGTGTAEVVVPPPRSSSSSESLAAGGHTHRRQPSRAKSEDEPAFNFAGFLKDLRTKPAEPVARYLKSFLTNFSRKPFTVNEQIKLIRDFLAFIAEKMRIVEPWRAQSAAEFDNAIEAMEKLVMNRLYPYTFTPQLAASLSTTITTDDLERDAVFAQRVRLFTWVKEKHLDVPEGEQSAGFLAFAETELLKINHYKAPRDKMICILNSCKVIFGLIRHTTGGEAGADAFVPILIFVVLRANPDNMLSNVEYINRFRNPEKLSGEAGYYLSSLQGAIAFIETMDASSLSNITQDEFETSVERAIRDLPSSPTSPRVESAGAGGSDLSPFATSPGEEPARPLTMPTTGAAALDGTKRFFQRTGDAAKEAVSRPLSAIGKILDSMQAAAESESGDESEDERDRAREQWQQQHQPGSDLTQRGHGHGRAASQPQPAPPSRLLAQLGLSPGGSESATPTARTPTPEAYHAHMQAQQAAQAQAAAAQYPGNFAQLSPAQQQQVYTQQQLLAASAQNQQQQHQQQLAQSLEASHDAYLRDQARLASVTTLHQMFPALGEDVVDVVLYSCGDDLGLAIDRLLEM